MALSQRPGLRYRLPLFPLPIVLLPGATLPLHIFEPRYRRMVARCLETDRRFGLIHHDWDVQGPFLFGEGRVGTVAEIHDHQPLEDGRSLIAARGVERFALVDAIESDALYFEGLVTAYRDAGPGLSGAALVERRRASLALFEAALATLPPGTGPEASPPAEEELSFPLARTLDIDQGWLQGLLELRDEVARLDRLDRIFRALVRD